MRLEPGQVAVVTGAASGIGLAMARRFAAEGLKVVLADVEEGALHKAAGELAAQGAQVLARTVDVSERDSVISLADAAYEAFGAVHVLCNNAGVGSGAEGRMWQHEPNDWQWAFSVNVWGVFHGIQAFVPRMIEAAWPGPRRQHLLRRRGHRPAAHRLRVRRHQGGRGHHDRIALRPPQGRGRRRGSLRPLPRTAHAAHRAVGVAPQPARALREAAAAQDPVPQPRPVRGGDEAGRARGGLHPVEEVAEHVVDGIRADRFWMLPASEHSDRQIRARSQSMLDRSNPAYLESFILD